MANKKQPSSPEGDKEKQLEEKVHRMLDPRLPDEEPPKIEVIKDDDGADEPAELPRKIELVDSGTPTDEPASAPPLDKKVAITHFGEDTDESAEPEPATPAEAALEENTQPAVAVDPTPESNDKPDPELDKAVDEIIAEESDKLLESQDNKAAEATAPDKKPSMGSRIRGFFAAWWHSKTARRLTFLVLLLLVAVAAVWPTSRYFALNTVGVRSSASLRVIDASTLQPLKNVEVRIHGQSSRTDSDGNATVEHIKLGTTTLTVEKRAFAPVEREVTIGWGSNPLDEQPLNPVGTQYSFTVTDFVSGEPLPKIEAVSGEASAYADEEGNIKLTLDMPADEFEVQLIGDEQRTETLTINADDKSVHQVAMVPAKKHVYISKRTGRYDVYAAYVDGRDEQLVLEGTGSERDDITLVPHPTDDYVALVSTRSNERNADGFLLSDLTLIDLGDDDDPLTVTQSERVQVIGWVKERLVYVQIAAGTSAANPDRHKLKTYNLIEGTDAELASANYFNDVMVAKNMVLYAPSSAYAKVPSALLRVNPDGSDQQVVHAAEVWSLFRTGHDTVAFTTGKDWYSFSLGSKYTESLEGEPANLISRAYVDNPAGTHSLWVDQRDGKGVLLATTVESGEDEVVFERSGLKLPVQWLNNSTIVFRVSTDQETADYAVSLNGGEPVKVADVTDTSGIDRWYYY